MKGFMVCTLALCLLLSGCAKPAPAKAADGADWSEDWVTVGNVLGVEEPGNDLVLRDNNEALSVTDTCLAPWTFLLLPILGVWYILFLSQCLIHEQLDTAYQIEEHFL